MNKSLQHYVLPLFCILLGLPQAVSASATAISISTVSPGSATNGIAVSLSANVSSSAGSISNCNLYVDNDDKGAMSLSGGTASKSFTFPSSQIYTVFVFCRDSAGNFNSGPNTAVWAKGGSSGGDSIAPTVGSISPSLATSGNSISFSALASDNIGVTSCNLFIAGVDQGAMSVSSGVASKTHSFTSIGTFSAYAQCKDAAGNIGTGLLSTVNVSVAPVPVPSLTPTPTPTIQGSLIKLECPVGALSDHPCKAVYYSGLDGKRHAFPNEKVFFTWYSNFESVQIVTQAKMSSLVLGKNVTYRPGSRMLKFPTVPMVYAVSKGGILRWVKTETDAISLYGTQWSTKVDDLSEAFFLDYKYGLDITPSAVYSVTSETNSALSIDDTL